MIGLMNRSVEVNDIKESGDLKITGPSNLMAGTISWLGLFVQYCLAEEATRVE